MKWLVSGAAVAVLASAWAGGASATVCSNACNHDYSVCNALHGDSAQPICMPKWMQCKKACIAPAKAPPTKVSNVTIAPKR